MEYSVSTPHCSIVIYLNKDEAIIAPFLQDVRQFFNKFPLQYEIVAVTGMKAEDCRDALKVAKQSSPQNETLVSVTDTTRHSRASGICRGLDEAKAPVILIADPLLATPLGDLFKILQNLIGDENTELCWGNRVSKKDNAFHSPCSARHRMEHFFNAILNEKYKISTDPLCEIGGIKKNAWQTLRSKIPTTKGWYLSPTLQKHALDMNLKKMEVPVYDSGRTSDSFSLWRERWSLLKQSLF